MANVWKVGSRWSENGSKETSVLSIFRRNNVVFIGSTDEIRARFFNEVKKGDYIAIADGAQIVAIAKAICSPALLKDLKRIEMTADDFEFNYESDKDWVVGVKVNIIEIDNRDYKAFCYKKWGTFFALNPKLGNAAIEYYNKQISKFSINSYTATLMSNEGNDYCSLLDKNTRYIIPVYQRPYEWGEEQIVPFINDLVNAYLGVDKTAKESEPIFIGTMQLSQKKCISECEYEQDVIDGQQRITTLSILLFELKKSYTNCICLKNLNFNWLRNRINAQQSYYLQSYFSNREELPLNKYYENSHIIRESFESAFPEEFEFNIDHFCNFLFNSVYFVIIETAAGLSKTIQIFNAINSTGLDLNGGDLFKVRMYEYLKECQSEDETVFEEINNVYQKIESANKMQGTSVTNIGEILDIYKNVLITKYNMPSELYAYGWETFYRRLFDTLLGIKDWGNSFNVANTNGLELSLDEINKIITIRFDYYQYTYRYLETEFASQHADWSRYSRSKDLMTYVFLFFYWNEVDVFFLLEQLIIEMNKLFFTFSIIYYKQVSEINTYVANAVQKVKITSPLETINAFKKKLEDIDLQKCVKDNLMGNINDNTKRKKLICSLSTYLSEKDICPQELIQHIFMTPFDIEHIHANADEDIEIDDILQNSIGNLTQLEQSFNRSIQARPFSYKRKIYTQSCYIAVKEIAELSQWNAEEAENRRTNEVNKMMSYLFGQ